LADDLTRLNNFDNLVWIQARSPKDLLNELNKITKAAAILHIGPLVGELGHGAYVEILGKGRKAKMPKIQRTKETKTQTLKVENNNG
jgi:hypothetical protein